MHSDSNQHLSQLNEGFEQNRGAAPLRMETKSFLYNLAHHYRHGAVHEDNIEPIGVGFDHGQRFTAIASNAKPHGSFGKQETE